MAWGGMLTLLSELAREAGCTYLWQPWVQACSETVRFKVSKLLLKTVAFHWAFLGAFSVGRGIFCKCHVLIIFKTHKVTWLSTRYLYLC